MDGMIKELKLYWNRITKSVYQYDIDYFEMKHFLEKKFPECYVVVTDLHKKTCNYEMLKNLVKLLPIKNHKYKKETFDCEDFSFEALGLIKFLFPRLAIGLCLCDVRGGKHATLCAVTRTARGRLSFTFVEPQNNKVFYTNWKPTLILI